MAPNVLVDTSVFIDYLRNAGKSSAILSLLLEERRVVLSPFVRLELLMGVRKEERNELSELLDGLHAPPLPVEFFKKAETLIPLVRKKGISSGLVDYLILLQALDLQIELFSLDVVMKKTAEAVSVELFRAE